jgi:predicted dehydrogenase
MKKLKIGFIGTGSFARKAHYMSLARIDSAEIVAVCENTHVNRMQELAEKYDIPEQYNDYTQMLTKADIDAVFAIMRPTFGLKEIACDILAAGKHLFLEKPAAMSVPDMQEMVKAAKKSGCYTMVGFNRRRIPILVEAHRIVAERGISSISATFFKHEMKNDWVEGSKLWSNGIHSVDTLRWMADSEIKEVKSAVSKAFTDHDNSWHALIRFENGIVATLLTNYSAGARSNSFSLHGKGISAYVDPDDSATIYADGKGREPIKLSAKEFSGSDEFIETYGIRAEDQHFVESILQGESPMPDFQDTLKTLELVEAIEKGRI